MSYAANEIAQIHANLKQIETYVTEHWVPRLREYDSISVNCGDLKVRPGQYMSEREHAFGFNSEGKIWWRTGGLVLYLNPPGHFSDHNLYDHWMYGLDMLTFWLQIKYLVENEFIAKEKRTQCDISVSNLRKGAKTAGNTESNFA